MKNMAKKLLAVFMALTTILCTIPFFASAENLNTGSKNCLAELECTDEGHYTGNMGDSRVYRLDKEPFVGVSPYGYTGSAGFNGTYRNGGDGTVYENGLEVFLARWNYGDNISWAYRTFKLGKQYKILSGKSGLICSYKNSFDVTAYFYNGDELLYSFNMTPNNYKTEFNIDVSNVDELKVLIKDNIKTAGGTSFALYDLFLDYHNDSEIPADAVEFNGHYYKVYEITGKNWEEAKAYCENVGGHLVTITSKEEQEFITSKLTNKQLISYWIGGIKVNGEFTWITGEEWSFSNWHPGEPNSASSKELYVQMYHFGKWNDTTIDIKNLDGTLNTARLSNTSFVCEWENNSALDNKNVEYIESHVNFIKNSYGTLVNDYRYAESIWESYHSGNSKAWAEYIHDIIEGTYEALSFKEISSLKNPYDAFLLNFLAANQSGAFLGDKFKENVVTQVVEMVKKFGEFFNADDEWADSDIKSCFEDLLGSKTKDYSTNKLYIFFDKITKGKTKNGINKFFNKFKCFGSITEGISDFLSGADYALEMLKFTAAIEAYYSSCQELKDCLKDISDEMYTVNKDFAEKFNEAYSTFSDCVNYDSISKLVLEHAAENGIWLILDLTSSVIESVTVSFCQKALGLTKTAASKFVASIWALKTGFFVSNLITGNDQLVECRRILRANYLFDEASYRVMEKYKNNLITSRTYNNAIKFDCSFNIYKSIQLSSIDLHKKYLQVNADKALFGILKDKSNKAKNEAERVATWYSIWNNSNCHASSTKIVSMRKRLQRIVSIITEGTIRFTEKSNNKAPSIIALKALLSKLEKSSGGITPSSIDEIASTNGSDTYFVAIGDELAICVDDLSKYTIEVDPDTSDPATIKCHTLGNTGIDSTLEFAEINQVSGEKYSILFVERDGVVSNDSYIQKENGATISTDGTTHYPSANCSCKCHKSGFAGFIWKIMRIFYKIFKTHKTCACGVAHY